MKSQPQCHVEAGAECDDAKTRGKRQGEVEDIVDDQQREGLPHDRKPIQAHQRVETDVAPWLWQMFTQFSCHGANLGTLLWRSTRRVAGRETAPSHLAPDP